MYNSLGFFPVMMRNALHHQILLNGTPWLVEFYH